MAQAPTAETDFRPPSLAVPSSPKHPAYDEAFALEFFYDAIEHNPDDSLVFHILKNITPVIWDKNFCDKSSKPAWNGVRAMQEEITSVLLPRFDRRWDVSGQIHSLAFATRSL
jgi:hypothetical protein